ncbi:MAG: hypothetical protein ACI8UO_000726 [Verrucomicrobiales bacterium]|jgi:hypothetical protein
MTETQAPPPANSRGWKSNLLFVAISLAIVSSVIGTLLKSRSLDDPASFDVEVYKAAEFRDTVDSVDEAFETHWAAAGLAPASQADDLTIARRLSLGLTGVIPSLEEIRAIEAQPADQRIQWFLSHIFEDSRFGFFIAERFGRAFVSTSNAALVSRRRRMIHWLAEEFRENRPYDELVRSLITAEGIWTSNPAANFFTSTNVDKKGLDEEVITARFSRAFLGIRMDCMQCHDEMKLEEHIEPRWKQVDFHQLAAFFGKAEITISGLRDKAGAKHMVRYRGEADEVQADPEVPYQHDLLPARGKPRNRLAIWATHPENKAFARVTVNRVWAILFGRPLVDPIDNLGLDGPWPPGLEILADDFIAHNFDLQRLMRLIASTRVFQLDSHSPDGQQLLTAEHDSNWASFPLTRLRPEQVAKSITQSGSLSTVDEDSPIFLQLKALGDENKFVSRYGDQGVEEFEDNGGTIPQRLIMMNGNYVQERTNNNIVLNASARISRLAQSNEQRVEIAYLTVMSRRPSKIENDHFVSEFEETTGKAAVAATMQDLLWSLLNSTEFSWNH